MISKDNWKNTTKSYLNFYNRVIYKDNKWII